MRDTLLFSKKKNASSAKIQLLQAKPHLRTHEISRACAEAALRAAATLYDRAKLRSSGRVVVSVLASRDRFEVLGVGGDINKSTTFGTEYKCNPLEATVGAALRYQTLRSVAATEIGAGPGTVNVAKMVGGGSLCLYRDVSKSSTGCLRPPARPERSFANRTNGFSRKPVGLLSGLLTPDPLRGVIVG